jgi:SAM-dependent methyltransferase
VGVVQADDVQLAYSAIADQYIELFAGLEHVRADDVRLIEHHLGHVEGPVLDLGCGPGHLTEYLRSLAADVTGIDLVPEFLEHARRTYPAATFERGSFRSVARAASSVAGVLCYYSLIHVKPDEMETVLRGIRRLMVPGGAIVIGFFLGTTVEPFEHKVACAYRWPTEELAAVLDLAGFVVIDRLERPGDASRRAQAVVVAYAA